MCCFLNDIPRHFEAADIDRQAPNAAGIPMNYSTTIAADGVLPTAAVFRLRCGKVDAAPKLLKVDQRNF